MSRLTRSSLGIDAAFLSAITCAARFPAPPTLRGEELKAWRQEHRGSPNRLRHNAATLLERQFGREAAHVVPGHSSVSVTDVYIAQDLARAIAAMERVG